MKTTNVTQFVRRDIAAFEEYKPVPSAWDMKKQQGKKFTDLIKLDAGENTFGPSPKVKKVVAAFDGYQFYPDPEYKELRTMLAEYTGASQESIVIGNGGDEIIDLLTRLTLEPGDEVINLPPTFSSYGLSTSLSHGKIINIPRTEKYEIDTAAIADAITKRTKLIFICNPNNPTGTVTNENDIKTILKLGIPVVVDEAYFEFSSHTVAPLLNEFDNLIIIRSFSKWAGIAGLRIGYALLNPALASQLMKIKPPYNVNTAAEVAARASLSDMEYYKKTIATIIAERERMYKALTSIKTIKSWPSGGNYIYVELDSKMLEKLKADCSYRQVALRYYKNAVRITIGRPEQNKKVINIFKNL